MSVEMEQPEEQPPDIDLTGKLVAGRYSRYAVDPSSKRVEVIDYPALLIDRRKRDLDGKKALERDSLTSVSHPGRPTGERQMEIWPTRDVSEVLRNSYARLGAEGGEL